MNNTRQPDLICVGVISGAFGVKGEVRLKSFCAEPSAIADYTPLSDETGEHSFDLTLMRPIKGGYAARLSGISDKEAADALRGLRLFAPKSRLPELEEDEYYHADLIGLTALDTGGEEIGRVKAVLNHGASDILELHVPGAKSPLLLPFTHAVVPTVDIAGRRLIVDLPEEISTKDDG